MYVVKLTKPMPVGDNPFRDGYFPRTLRYLADAKSLILEVKTHGGQAVIERTKATPKRQTRG